MAHHREPEASGDVQAARAAPEFKEGKITNDNISKSSSSGPAHLILRWSIRETMGLVMGGVFLFLLSGASIGLWDWVMVGPGGGVGHRHRAGPSSPRYPELLARAADRAEGKGPRPGTRPSWASSASAP